MTNTPFSDSDLDTLAEEVNRQLQALTVQTNLEASMRGIDVPAHDFPPAQGAVLALASGQPAPAFWSRFSSEFRKDLCNPNEGLGKQWAVYRDVKTKDVLTTTGATLLALGIQAPKLEEAAVAASVVVIHQLLRIGIRAFCEGC